MLNEGVPTKVIAATLGLCAFAAAIVAGMAAGNPAPTVVLRALAALLACYAVGLCVGWVGERTVAEHLRSSPGKPAGPAAAGAPAVPSEAKKGNEP